MQWNWTLSSLLIPQRGWRPRCVRKCVRKSVCGCLCLLTTSPISYRASNFEKKNDAVDQSTDYTPPTPLFSMYLSPTLFQSSDSFVPMEGDIVEFVTDASNSAVQMASLSLTRSLACALSSSFLSARLLNTKETESPSLPRAHCIDSLIILFHQISSNPMKSPPAFYFASGYENE